MTSIVSKKQGNKTYLYAVESARVDGKPRIVSQTYLGSTEEVLAKLTGAEASGATIRSAHRDFGDVAAVWGMLESLDIAGIIDEVVAGTDPVKGLSVGRFLAIAALNRVVAPCSKAQIADWWAGTAGPRFTKISAAKLDHRRFWDAMNQLTESHLQEISIRIAARIVKDHDLDTSALALDMTNFATWVDSGNDAATLLARGKSKQKRTDLRLLGLGLVVTRDGSIPLAWHPYPGNRPDVSVFTETLDTLTASFHAIAGTGASGTRESGTGHTGEGGGVAVPGYEGMTVVFDAGQNSAKNFTHLINTGARYVGSTPPSDHQDLLKVPMNRFTAVPGYPGIQAHEDSKTVYGQPQRILLTHSDTLHQGQARGFDQTLGKATAKLEELAQTLARGKSRRTLPALTEHIKSITANSWVTEVLRTTLTGETPATFRLSFAVDAGARKKLENRVFGKRILITNHQHWLPEQIVAAYRSQSHVEDSFRQLKDRQVVSFSPMHHWTDDHIRVHTFTCVLALQIAHLMTRTAARAGHELSTRALLDELGTIEETVLLHHDGAKGRPRAQRLLTEHSKTAEKLGELFDLKIYAPTR